MYLMRFVHITFYHLFKDILTFTFLENFHFYQFVRGIVTFTFLECFYFHFHRVLIHFVTFPFLENLHYHFFPPADRVPPARTREILQDFVERTHRPDHSLCRLNFHTGPQL